MEMPSVPTQEPEDVNLPDVPKAEPGKNHIFDLLVYCVQLKSPSVRPYANFPQRKSRQRRRNEKWFQPDTNYNVLGHTAIVGRLNLMHITNCMIRI